MRFNVVGALENESLRNRYFENSSDTTHKGLKIDFDSESRPVIGFGYDLVANKDRINSELIAYLNTSGLTAEADGSYKVPKSATDAIDTYMESGKSETDREKLQKAWSSLQLQIKTVADARNLLNPRMENLDEAIDKVAGNKLLAGSKEKIALCHLFYNTLDTSLSAEKLATTIKKSNPSLSNILENQQDDPSFRASLWVEIKFFSNKGEDKSTQTARNNAAKLFGLFDLCMA